MQNQYYTDIAYQYGRLVRKLWDFEAIAASSKDGTFNEDIFDLPSQKERKDITVKDALSGINEYLMQIPLVQRLWKNAEGIKNQSLSVG